MYEFMMCRCLLLASKQLLTAAAFAAAIVIQQHQHHPQHNNNNAINNNGNNNIMVIFRSPSHHTYGFIDDEKKTNNNYDLPQIELTNLLLIIKMMGMRDDVDIDDEKNIQLQFEFIPVDESSSSSIMKQQQQQQTNNIKILSRNQSKKKKKKKRQNKMITTLPPSIYWLKCSNSANNNNAFDCSDNIDNNILLSKVTQRAILTHAIFRIHISLYNISDKDWNLNLNNNDNEYKYDEAESTTSMKSNKNKNKNKNKAQTLSGILLDEDQNNKFDIIDMSNPNMSNNERCLLIKKISCLIDRYNYPELQLSQIMQQPTLVEGRQQYQDPIIIIIHTQQQQQQHYDDDSNSNSNNNNILTHQLHFGYRIAIGPAGTKGAPSRTFRRPHRGILLKKYALKLKKTTSSSSRIINNNYADNTITTAQHNNNNNKNIISTAMEPEIGFLMANLLALGDGRDRDRDLEKKSPPPLRILDPCCGSGRLLLYVAAASLSCNCNNNDDDDVNKKQKQKLELFGVDSNPKVWTNAKSEFERLLGHKTSTFKFIHGDVLNPITDIFCTPNSFDGIICDPPYNIGAPILLLVEGDGTSKDLRPRNYHHNHKRDDVDYEDDDNDRRGDESGAGNNNNQININSTTTSSSDIISSIISIAETVLVKGGRIVFFLPVRGKQQQSTPLKKLLQKDLDECSNLRLLINSSRLQTFSPTFSRWLVCMEKK